MPFAALAGFFLLFNFFPSSSYLGYLVPELLQWAYVFTANRLWCKYQIQTSKNGVEGEPLRKVWDRCHVSFPMQHFCSWRAALQTVPAIGLQQKASPEVLRSIAEVDLLHQVLKLGRFELARAERVPWPLPTTNINWCLHPRADVAVLSL